MRSLLPVDPVDVFVGVIGGIVGKVLLFFLVAGGGYAAGLFSASFVGFADFFSVDIWGGVIAGVVEAPLGWGLSLVVGFLDPLVGLLTVGYFWFAYQVFWGERDKVKLLGCLAVYEAVRSYLYQDNGIGLGVIFLLGISAGVLVGVWTFSRVVYESEMRRLEEIAAENAEKRAAKERGERGMAAEDAAARERLRRGRAG